MNVATMPVSPLSYSASKQNSQAGLAMKNRWIAQTLAEMHRVNQGLKKDKTH